MMGEFCNLGKHPEKKYWYGRLFAAILNECFKVGAPKTRARWKGKRGCENERKKKTKFSAQ